MRPMTIVRALSSPEQARTLGFSSFPGERTTADEIAVNAFTTRAVGKRCASRSAALVVLVQGSPPFAQGTTTDTSSRIRAAAE
jgi:hypothetical protein